VEKHFFRVVSLAITQKYFDAGGEDEYYFRSGCSASEGTGI
jgi:hypothetical protein